MTVTGVCGVTALWSLGLSVTVAPLTPNCVSRVLQYVVTDAAVAALFVEVVGRVANLADS